MNITCADCPKPARVKCHDGKYRCETCCILADCCPKCGAPASLYAAACYDCLEAARRTLEAKKEPSRG